MKISSPIKTILISTFFGFSVLPAHAAIIDFDTYFNDSESGLSWLDVTATVNRSYNDISSQLGVGGEFDGWRYATGTEFNALLSNWTGTTALFSGRTITTGTSPSVDGLVTLFGSTLDSSRMARYGQTWDSQFGYAEGEGIDFTLGILADLFNNSATQRQVAAIWDNEANGDALDFYNNEHRQILVADAKSDIGSFLVRGVSNSTGGNGGATAVTEPQTMVLFSLGLMGIFLSRRKVIAI
tara:strand:- start:19618 stop:20337 length:720 start_codon:yes stop_codon:yes gene_type:complete